MEQESSITLLGFLGQEGKSLGKYFALLLNIKIEGYATQVSYKICPLVKGVDIIILRGWFLIKRLMSFEGNGIQVKQHIYDLESIISYDEPVLDEETVWVGSLTATKALRSRELKELVPSEYHSYKNLFGELLAQQLPPHQSFDH
jgi:hypothetical protein